MALTNKLSAIGDAIRNKTGKSDLLTLEQMPTEINSIETAGSAGGICLTGSLFKLFYPWSGIHYDDLWAETYYYPKFLSENTTTKDITDISQSFRQCTLTNIPFAINLIADTAVGAAFAFAESQLHRLPIILGTLGAEFGNFCYNCENLNNVDGLTNTKVFTGTKGKAQQTFYGCKSLRRVPESFLQEAGRQPYTSYNYTFYYRTFYNDFVLDEVKNLGVSEKEYTSNMFNSTIYMCYRLKDFAFETNSDGTAKVASWKGQTIDLTNVGVTPDLTIATDNGIAADKAVTDDATYQALKNDPDWFSFNDNNYSRFNHDSAVNTINSLPDTSAYLATAGGTNTVKFTGAKGALTDGGAINTLTEEEIAVATAKGWTVTLV